MCRRWKKRSHHERQEKNWNLIKDHHNNLLWKPWYEKIHRIFDDWCIQRRECTTETGVFYFYFLCCYIYYNALFRKKIHSRGFITYCFCVCVKKTAYGNKKKREIFSDGQEKNCLEFLRMFIFDIGTLMVWHNFAKFSGKLWFI